MGNNSEKQSKSRFQKFIDFSIKGIVVTGILYLLAAFALTFSPQKDFKNKVVNVTHTNIAADDIKDYKERYFQMRDGAKIYAKVFGDQNNTNILMLHGVATNSQGLEKFAYQMARENKVRITIFDLRGHGKSDGEMWQTAYIGQYEDDIADIIKQIKSQNNGPLIIAGHSMGGGIVLRYALAQNAPNVDGYLLASPLLGGDSESMKPKTNDVKPQNAPKEEEQVIFRTPRMIGVLMFNIIGIKSFNHLPIMLFNHDDQPSYGFNALASMQPNEPKDYKIALGSIKTPLLLIAGKSDEYFNANAYPQIIKNYSKGDAILIDKETHEGILNNNEAILDIKNWLVSNKFVAQ